MPQLEEEQGNVVNLRDFFKLCLDKWYWFAISVVVCLSIGAFYVMKTTATYERSALIQIRDDKHGGSLNNEFANAAALAVGNNEPASAYSPLFLYGGVGLR